jgi:hypothetical protein
LLYVGLENCEFTHKLLTVKVIKKIKKGGDNNIIKNINLDLDNNDKLYDVRSNI